MAHGNEFVLYWMQAYRRLDFNPALARAQARALEQRIPLLIVETLAPDSALPYERQLVFALEGALETAREARRKGLTYRLLLESGKAGQATLETLARRARLVVTDDYPCAGVPERTRALAKRIGSAAVVAVDGNGVVPLASFPKEEFAARTLRPKIHRLFPLYLDEAGEESARPELDPPLAWSGDGETGLVDPLQTETLDPRQLWPAQRISAVPPSPGFRGGRPEALRRLDVFLRERLNRYAEDRNDPSLDATSQLSPYLRFGFISSLEIARAVPDHANPESDGAQAFLEELIVRRELSFNFVRHNPEYASFAGLPEWARKTLRKHARDKRPHLYGRADFERARTHDGLWNAAQTELVRTGRMHGYVRMYWGKMMLEWSRDPAEALEWALALNNKYALDGGDPNSYAGVLWCWGKHDRPWGPERKVFGLVRCMTTAGMRRKFDVDRYVAKFPASGS